MALQILGFGEATVDRYCVVERYPSSGAKLAVNRFEQQGGGQVASALVAAVRLGATARYLGPLGGDAEAQWVLEHLQREGVAVAPSALTPDTFTQTATILVEADSGERTVLFQRDHQQGRRVHEQLARLATSDEPARWLVGADALHLDATAPDAALLWAKLARQAGVVVSLDIDEPVAGWEQLVATVDVCVTSAGLPERLTGHATVEKSLRALARLGPRWVGSTLGEGGAAAYDAAQELLLRAPAFRRTMVDTTGCGDVFHAAFLVAILEKQPLADALRFANAAAALNGRGLGAQPASPTRAEVESLLSANRLW